MILSAMPKEAWGQTGCACAAYPGYQCIEGDFNAQSLYFTKLLPPNQALNTPQFIVIRGKLTFDEDYSFATGSVIVFLDNDSGLRVFNNKKLTLSYSWLHGCAKLWAGVEVMGSAKIVAQSCTFEDAKAAIILRNQSVIEITGNTFKKNVCGILGVDSNLGVASISILLGSRRGISGNKFWGNDELLESISPTAIDPGINSSSPVPATNYPYTGIWIERVKSLTIGFFGNQVGVPFNSFLNFGKNQELNVKTQGIRSIQSNVTIRNSTFSNFGNYDPINSNNSISADAVFAQNDGVVITQTTFIGTNKTSSLSSTNTFSSCYRDIHAIGTHLTVIDMTSYRAGNSVTMRMANNGQNAITCQIKNNKIDYFKGVGIDVGFFNPLSINIQNNKIFDNNELFDPAQRYGIWIHTSGSSPETVLKGSQIRNNEIRSRSMLQEGSFWGIILGKSSYLTIEQNQIAENQTQTNLATFFGIRTQQSPCNGIRLYSNIINGSKIDYELAAGILINNSVNCVLNCNETDKTNAGILFLQGCDNADVSKNRFNFHNKGLALGYPPPLNIPATIGLQSAKENRWLGTNSPIEAFAIDIGSALSSKFEINSSDLNSDYWPSPRKIGMDDDLFTWFVPLTGQEPSNDFSCLTETPFGEGKLADTDTRLLNGTYQPPLNYPALTWEARWQFADRLNRNSALQTINGSTAQYFQNTYNESYSRLNRVYQAYLNRWRPANSLTTAVENGTAALNSAVEQRFALDTLLSESWEDNTNLHTQMVTADAVIENTTSALKTTSEALVTLVNQNVTGLLTEVDGIVCLEAYESDMKAVLNTILLSHAAGGILTAQQSTQMADIAAKCRYSGGYAVVLARGFFEPQDSYPQDITCTTGERSDTQKAPLSDVVSLYPNPTSELLTLQIGLLFERGTARLFNAQGVLLNTFDIQGQSTVLPITDVQNGSYFIEIRLDGRPSIHKAFVKIH